MSKIHVTCAECNAINAVPSERLEQNPLCGKCRKPVLNAHPVELDTAGFERFISKNDVPVLVDFWAPWCAPCRTMAPAFEQAASTLEPTVRLAKLNTEDEQMIGAQYGIRSIPTMILFNKGKEVARQSGALMAGDIVRWAKSQVA